MIKSLFLAVLGLSTMSVSSMEVSSFKHKYSPLINKYYEDEDAFRLYQLGYAAYTANTSSPELKEKNLKDAKDFFTRATNKGQAEAAAYLGQMWEYGEGGGKKNIQEAERLYLIAHEAGVLAGTTHLADLYQKTNQLEKALKFHTILAKKGHSGAQIAVGNMHLNGSHKDYKLSPNFETAIEWYKKAADQGDLRGDFALGRTYYLLHDYEAALPYLEKVCKIDNAAQRLGEAGKALLGEAKYALADIYGPKRYGKIEDAIKLYHEAVAFGNKPAKQGLQRFIALLQTPEGKERIVAEENRGTSS
ncbi:MAG: sel1 repeat family protein [Candidatus Paracaedibacteraceae bacterium]|nr:sel1 repeat family protein [Candidatus Paracaedibacteraceae bacterium]